MNVLLNNLFLIILVMLTSHSTEENANKLKKLKEKINYKIHEKVQRNLENDNYIILYFNRDCSYTSGFVNVYRNDIDFIISGNKNYMKEESFNVINNIRIEIHFNKAINSLNNFFNSNIDENMNYLKFVDFTNFNSISVSDMSYMFYNCYSLQSIDLSNFDTSNVVDMGYMFYGCSSLISIDLSNFDMINCNSYDNMFSDISNIRYINIYNLKNDKIIANTFNNMNNRIFVCQKEIIINNPQAYNCCDSNYKTYDCRYPYKKNINLSTNNKKSSSSVSSGAVIGIIDGAVVIFVVFIIIIFYKCGCPCKKFSFPWQRTLTPISHVGVGAFPSEIKTINPNTNNLNNNVINQNVIPQNDNVDNIKVVFVNHATIYINPKKTIEELIKIYFETIKRSDLYGDKEIVFLTDGKNISVPYPKDPVESLKNNAVNSNTINIIISDQNDKLKKKTTIK